MKKYRLEQRYIHRDHKGIEHWKIVRQHDDWNVLKQIAPIGFRIVDNRTGQIMWEVK